MLVPGIVAFHFRGSPGRLYRPKPSIRAPDRIAAGRFGCPRPIRSAKACDIAGDEGRVGRIWQIPSAKTAASTRTPRSTHARSVDARSAVMRSQESVRRLTGISSLLRERGLRCPTTDEASLRVWRLDAPTHRTVAGRLSSPQGDERAVRRGGGPQDGAAPSRREPGPGATSGARGRRLEPRARGRVEPLPEHGRHEGVLECRQRLGSDLREVGQRLWAPGHADHVCPH